MALAARSAARFVRRMTPVPSGRGTSELLRVRVPLGSAGTAQELPGTRPPERVVPRPGKQRLNQS